MILEFAGCRQSMSTILRKVERHLDRTIGKTEGLVDIRERMQRASDRNVPFHDDIQFYISLNCQYSQHRLK